MYIMKVCLLIAAFIISLLSFCVCFLNFYNVVAAAAALLLFVIETLVRPLKSPFSSYLFCIMCSFFHFSRSSKLVIYLKNKFYARTKWKDCQQDHIHLYNTITVVYIYRTPLTILLRFTYSCTVLLLIYYPRIRFYNTCTSLFILNEKRAYCSLYKYSR